MAFSFLIPLVVVLVAVYIFKNSADEIAYLAVAISAVGLILTLILAPWQLKILLLLVLLVNTKLWFPNREVKPGNSSPQSAESANLEFLNAKSEQEAKELPANLLNPLEKGIYRGVNYDRTTLAVKLSETQINRKYRGQVCKSSQTETSTAVQPKFELKYRGATVNAQKSIATSIEQAE